MPSHVQVGRVVDGGLDAAVAWAAERDERLSYQLLWAEPLLALSTRATTAPVAAEQLTVLVDSDLTSWDAWNQYATEFADTVGCRVVRIDDGGITGTAFHQHCQRLNAPVLASPKRHRTARPSGLRARPVRNPTPLWCWSLITRTGGERTGVVKLRDQARHLMTESPLTDLPAGPVWVPAGDPHHALINDREVPVSSQRM